MNAPGPARPDCAAPPADPAASRRPLPPDACDSHVHVFGPQADYPLDGRRDYTPHVCTLDDYRRVMRALGLARAVLIQPSVYGVDNRALLDALDAGGDALRGVAVPPPELGDAGLRDMHARGVRGIRLNLVNPQVLAEDDAVRLCRRAAGLGLDWHLQVQLRLQRGPGAVDALRALARRAAVPLVLDHMGRPEPDAHAGALLDFFATGACWIKLSAPYRSSRLPYPHADLAPLARALAGARPDRLLWGSDWPHTEQAAGTPRAADLADLLHDWIPDAAALRATCVDNPARLYGF